MKALLLTASLVLACLMAFAGSGISESEPIAVDTFPLLTVNDREVDGPTRVAGAARIQLSARFPQGAVFYTLDGTAPTRASTRYSGPITTTESVEVRQLSVSQDGTDSVEIRPARVQIVTEDRPFAASAESGDVALDSFPGLLANGLEIDGATRQGDRAEIRLVSRFPGGQIFYTTDGSEPTLDSPRYTAPFTVTQTTLIRQLGLSDDFTQTAVVAAIPVEILPTYALTAATSGSGRIERIPALNRYLQDDVVQVRAVPNAGWRFVRWEGDLTGAFPERSVVLNRDRSVRAVFESIPRYLLSVVAQGGTVSGGGLRLEGTTVDLIATPDVGWSFLGWTGDFVGSETNFSWVVDGSAGFTANFGTPITRVATGSGRILLEPDLPVYPYGTRVRVTPAPDPGFALTLWGAAGTGQPKSGWILEVTNAAPRITALFQALAADKVVLTIQSSLGGRVVQPSPDGLYAKGSTVALSAVSDPGYEFVGWSGAVSGTASALDLLLDTSKTVRAEFRRAGVQTHPVVVAVEGPGTVRRVPDLGAYEVGSEVELVAEPSADAAFLGWSGAVTGTQRRVRVTITGPLSVQALFRPIHPVATEVRGEGQILLSPPEGRYVAGTELALTAKPAEGWGFVQWSGDLGSTAQEAVLTVDAPKRVIAEFARLGTVTTRVIGSGTISKTPDAASYLPGTVLTLTAAPTAGWKFMRWTGGATGTNAEVQVVVGRTEAIVAEFGDGQAPVVEWTAPVEGTVTSEGFRLAGTVTDNVGLDGVSWTWNGQPQGKLALVGNAFAVEGLTLKPGSNLLGLTATDLAGNVSTAARTVVWNPERVLQVQGAAEVQEGQILSFPVTLTSSGEVGGMTFWLQYDPVFLGEPQLEWGAASGQSINRVNTTTNGQVWATFSLAGNGIPAGTNAVAVVSFRARSVPEATAVTVVPTLVSVGRVSGEALPTGTAAIAGAGRILPRKILGDNNANQRLDVGDGVLLARLQVGLDEVRPWDVRLNDLNASGTLDNGDVIKVLRAVVGLDLQPKAAPRGGELRVESRESREEGALSRPVLQSTAAPTGDGAERDLSPTSKGAPAPGSQGTAAPTVRGLSEAALNPQLSALSSQPRRLLRLSGNTNDVLGLEFPDGDTAKPGVPWRVLVKLARSGSAIAGLSFTVGYPQSVLTLTGKQVGALVPADSLPLWAENPGSVSLAAVRSTAWPTSTGAVAVLTFLPGPGITGQATWPLVVSQAEITGSGFDIRPVDTVNAVVKGGGGSSEPPVVVVTPPSADGKLNLQVEAPVGSEVVLETTTDLSTWSVSQRSTGQGPGKPVTFPVVPENGTVARFWRVRVP